MQRRQLLSKLAEAGIRVKRLMCLAYPGAIGIFCLVKLVILHCLRLRVELYVLPLVFVIGTGLVR